MNFKTVDTVYPRPTGGPLPPDFLKRALDGLDLVKVDQTTSPCPGAGTITMTTWRWQKRAP